MARTLQPEDTIAHYRIVGPLGAGGMGEVYRARDTRLERDVALKILPPELVRSEDRVKRFILEAKSASSLSHPHIVTIYDIGRDAVRSSGDGDTPGEEVHYIAMELVNGRTVHDHIHNEKTDLKTLLRHLAQAAEGLSKAHAAGIVHRDLKPGNIMVTQDGYAKVLDFGLAKLTEKSSTEDDITSAPTEVEKTTAGTVVGTVGYMSPEQVKGKTVDHRSDVFSFGCILYEAATRTRPFHAESKFDTMHKIVHDQPAPIDTINAEVPAELRRLIKRCLAKNADQRLQSIKDLALEVREIVDEFDTLSATATSASGISPAPAIERRSGASTALIAAVAVIGLAGIAFGIWSIAGRGGAGETAARPFETMRMRSLMDDSNIFGATLSGDGRYLAYIRGPVGQWSLWVRQVSTGSDVKILDPQTVPIRGVGFSPDGDYLYYLGRDPDTPIYSALFEVPSLGGTPRKRIFDIDTAPAFSPDAKRVAFVRGLPHVNQSHLIIADPGTAEEQVLVAAEMPDLIHNNQPGWSPDGDRVVVIWHTVDQGVRHTLVAFDASGEGREEITEPDPISFTSFAWMPDGSGLIATRSPDAGRTPQIFFVPYPKGEARQITNDLDTYANVSLSSDGTTIGALRLSRDSSLWSVSAKKEGTPRQITARSRTEGIAQLLPLPDGSLMFTAMKDRYRQIWRSAGDGSGRVQITSQAGWSWALQNLGDQGVIFTHSPEGSQLRSVWRTDAQGGDLRKVTDGSGEFLGAVSRDGKTALFGKDASPGTVWSISTEGGQAREMFKGGIILDAYSPDGRILVYSTDEEIEGRQRDVFHVIPAEGGDEIARFVPPGDYADMEWSADSRALTYIHGIDGVSNLWRQPIDGGDPVRITRFTEGIITDHELAPDGSLIALDRRQGEAENVWTVTSEGQEARPLTDFREGDISDLEWSRDAETIFLVQGVPQREVVLIEDTGP